MATAIRRVTAGRLYFAEDVVATLVRGERRREEEKLLTERETEVLRLLAAGLGNKEIGKALYLSPNTVKTHLSNIYHKPRVDSRTQAVVVALRRGLLE